MWESSKLLLSASSTYSSVTGNPEYLKALGTPKKKTPYKPNKRHYGNTQMNLIEQLIEWNAPAVTGTEKDLIRDQINVSVHEYQKNKHYVA